MKRSDMVLDIASTLVDEITDFISFSKAQLMAEKILETVEKSGMMPPYNNDYYSATWRTDGNPYVWESEGEEND